MWVECDMCRARGQSVPSASCYDLRGPSEADAIRVWNARHGIEHADDEAVRVFAEAMCDKMASSRAKGRTGWSNPELCSTDVLCQQLIGHMAKGNENNFIDLATFAMMLHMRGDDPKQLAEMFNTIVEQKARQLMIEEAC